MIVGLIVRKNKKKLSPRKGKDTVSAEVNTADFKIAFPNKQVRTFSGFDPMDVLYADIDSDKQIILVSDTELARKELGSELPIWQMSNDSVKTLKPINEKAKSINICKKKKNRVFRNKGSHNEKHQ